MPVPTSRITWRPKTQHYNLIIQNEGQQMAMESFDGTRAQACARASTIAREVQKALPKCLITVGIQTDNSETYLIALCDGTFVDADGRKAKP